MMPEITVRTCEQHKKRPYFPTVDRVLASVAPRLATTPQPMPRALLALLSPAPVC